MLDLKNCPFCGGDKVSVQHGTTSTRGQYLMVWCVSCQAAGGEHLAEAEAIAAWNRRALQAVGPESVAGLSLSELQRAHIERQEEWCPDQKPDLSFRGNEMAGEVGEACNVIKKLERERHGWRGSRATKEQLAEELADVIHTAVLCSITAGIDIETATIAKFDATSEKNDLSSRIRSALVATPPAETLPSPSSLSMSKCVITAAYDRDEDARRAYDILEGSATPPAGGDDWTVDDTLTAREILDYLGIGSDASLEPYADRRRDAVAKIIQKRVATTPPAETVVEALRTEADSAYCRFLDKMSAPLCLGVEHKLETGKFGAAELNAHVDARELYGFHRGINHALAALATKPAVKDDETLVEALPPTGEYVDRIVRIFRDRPADDTSAVVLQDYARAALAAKDGRS